jgi:agmatinase
VLFCAAVLYGDGVAVTRLRYLPSEAGFLGLSPEEAGDPDAARAVIIPFGLEATVCRGKGTGAGPEAIIAASPFLDFFDEEFWFEPHRRYGVATLDAPPPAAGLSDALDQIATLTERVLEAGKFPFILGGEHALTAGAVRPFARRWPGLTILHFDAHADLRESYEGSRYSHACAMRRALDHPGVSLISIGVRCFSAEEAAFYEASRDRVAIHWGREKSRWRIDEIVEPLRGRPVYVSFDVDGLDPSVMPATGTPEPGGPLFYEACDILRAAAQAGTIVGADLVEFAPIAGQTAWDITAARLAYKMMSYALLDLTAK